MTKVLNIDALIEETPLIIVLAGVEHKMKAPTLNDFIHNMKQLAEFKESDPVKEAELMVDMIARSFPTLTVEAVREWPTAAITDLFDVIRNIDTASVEDTEGGAEGNATAES